MKALICGAGIAGLTLAWHLERSGWSVELVEHAPEFRTGGYMIDFYGHGLEVAERMGLRTRLLQARYPVSTVSYVDRHGRRRSSLTMTEGLDQVISLMRGDLARAVHEQVRAPIHYGTSVAAISQEDAGVTVHLTDGTQREVDLLVGADGAHSRVRELAFGPEHRFLRFLGHHVAAYVIENEALNRTVGTRYQMLTEPGLMAGAYALRDGGLAALFLRREADPRLPDDGPAELWRHYGGLGWIVPELLRACPPASSIYYDQVTQVEMDQWSRGRVVLLGDACHAVSLFAGHGASLAMAGAWVLADELGGAGDDLYGALTGYRRRMAPAVAETQRFGRGFIEWMAPASRWRITARDWIVRLAGLPGANRLLLRSLTPGGHTLIRPRSETSAGGGGRTVGGAR